MNAFKSLVRDADLSTAHEAAIRRKTRLSSSPEFRLASIARRGFYHLILLADGDCSFHASQKGVNSPGMEASNSCPNE